MKIGAQIKKYRALKGLSQLDLALSIGYKNQADVSRIERDEQWPDGDRLDSIAKALGCNVSDFFIYAEYENDAAEGAAIGHHAVMERFAAYTTDSDDATLDKALKAVEFELPSIDPRTQATLAVEIYKTSVSKQNAERIVGALNSLVVAVEQLKP